MWIQMEELNQTVNNAYQNTLNQYNNQSKKGTAAGTFPKFVSQHYQKSKGSSHGDTMRNISSMYKNTTFYK